jgi:hypothetical protein
MRVGGYGASGFATDQSAIRKSADLRIHHGQREKAALYPFDLEGPRARGTWADRTLHGELVLLCRGMTVPSMG